ncbi:PLP-dependent aminotransferase family protein [Serratia marcescens]|uniref:MocR-like pyridoxine biosynthesis transcription factor PdxR n=1 Tax=Serratia marcescens TaxID=615 RepID=UPI000F7448EB|nr:PLP-dependent aminotransferase family protein [Serratia marcescens]EMD6650805.1 PLP-dependent aminotransferase family protein [Serratia marcescens]MDH2250494.1 PLP-dependent aminotransferase family protein [Serratia marcescens]MDH2256939.1 PLP-dependent aminotransferase family protein [Serratia marcescens]MDH2262009.1 PLP-dependent aminotransferase family protein [Serratia marcescens]MDP5267927.1 PLP-dependent aminotransferase family protein [Serratia marcescens]
MHIPLDREQDVPLYLQIEEALRRAILTGVFVDGDKLPSTRTLAAELAVSLLTVDNAYAELAAKGFLHQRRGSGAYVAHPQMQARPARPSSDAPFPLESFTTLTSRLDGYADAPLPEGLINFAAGVGSPKVFPLEAFRKVLLSVLSRHAEEAFSYGEYCGYYPLRDTLSRILSAQGIPTQAEQVLITNGSQHAISLVVQSLLAPGDTAIVEEPTYAEALGLLRQHRVNIVTVPGDRHGMRVDLLPELLERHRPKLIYTIPNFHNPTGRCLSEARRRRLLAIAQQAGVVILEDDFVGDLRYQGKQLPSLRALAQPGAVIYVSTFSKMLLPSMRIGYLVADSEHYQRFARLKHVDSFTSSSLIQRALDAFVTVGRYDKQLRRAGRVYRRHLEVMIDALQRRLPSGCRFETPQGGLFIWLTLPASMTTAELMPVAWRYGVTFARGECFYAQEHLGAHGLRLNFAANSPPQIEEGIARLCRAIEEVITEKNAG